MKKIAVIGILFVFMLALPMVSAEPPAPTLSFRNGGVVDGGGTICPYITNPDVELVFKNCPKHIKVSDSNSLLMGWFENMQTEDGTASIKLSSKCGPTGILLEGGHSLRWYGYINSPGIRDTDIGNKYFVVDTTAPKVVKVVYGVSLVFNPEFSLNPFSFKLFDATMDLDVVVHDVYVTKGANAVTQSGIKSVSINAPGVDFSKSYQDSSETGLMDTFSFEITPQDWLAVKQGADVSVHAMDWAGHSTTETEYSESPLLQALTPWLQNNYE